MDEIIIYGASDDLIEIDSTNFPPEEFNVDCDTISVLAFSDGTLLRVRYDEDGIWRFTPSVVGSANVTTWQCPTDDENIYSDRVTLTGDDLRWVVLANQIAK